MGIVQGQPFELKVLVARRRKNNLHPQRRGGSNGYDHAPTKLEHRAVLGHDPNWLARKQSELSTIITWEYSPSSQLCLDESTGTQSELLRTMEGFGSTPIPEIERLEDKADAELKGFGSTPIPEIGVSTLLGDHYELLAQKFGALENPKRIVYDRNVPKCLTVLNGEGTYQMLRTITEHNQFARLRGINQGYVKFSLDFPARVEFTDKITKKYVLWVGYNANKHPSRLFLDTIFDKNITVTRKGNTAIMKFSPCDELGNKFVDYLQERATLRKSSSYTTR